MLKRRVDRDPVEIEATKGATDRAVASVPDNRCLELGNHEIIPRCIPPHQPLIDQLDCNRDFVWAKKSRALDKAADRIPIGRENRLTKPTILGGKAW